MSPDQCINSQGQWTKLIPERLTEQERSLFAEFNRLCDGHIVTDHLSENTRIRFLYGFSFNIQEAFLKLIAAERWRYQNGADTLTGREFFEQGIRDKALIGRDIEGRAVAFTRCVDWQLARIPAILHCQNLMLLSDYIFAT